jgi:hypothetical protein
MYVTFFSPSRSVPIADSISHRHKNDDTTAVPRDSGQCGRGYVGLYWGVGGRREVGKIGKQFN